MAGGMMPIKGKDGSFDAYVAKPASGSGPAIVVIQEIFGVNHWIRDVADHYAALGYVAVAPDLFWRIKPGIQLDDTKPDELQQAFDLFGKFDVAKGVQDVQATIDAARGISSGKVGAVGFCLGGLLTYLTACRTDADAMSSYYGVAIDQHLDECDKITRPTLVHIASEDKFVSKEAQDKIMSGLSTNPHVTLYQYQNQDHAFARVGGDAYNAEAAEQANKRTEDFFSKTLK